MTLTWKQARSLEELRAELDRRAEVQPRTRGTISSGIGPLDRVLPGEGYRRGTLVEWIAPQGGSGATSLAWQVAPSVLREGASLVVIDPEEEFYPPGLATLGIDPSRLLVVRFPTKRRDAPPRQGRRQRSRRSRDDPRESEVVWALEQTLRCPAVGMTLASLESLESRSFRRLQLAAEQGGGVGVLLRGPTATKAPSWAEVRLRVEPKPSQGKVRRWRVELLKCRGAAGMTWEWERDRETGVVSLATQLAPPASRSFAAGAS
ncbi:Protein RecA [Planctomycetes bacterium Pan216]|uniref:Protein RecA n=1 Tax=Kolteria novifilia TaxID=2527975 RepID=A0A518B4I7_9BACT|nr:Protein RecA [Planctomycetes bacterium Pan216]